jgi:hypothetical protein
MLFNEFRVVSIEGRTHYLEPLKSSPFSQGLKLLLGPLFPTRIMSQHDKVNRINKNATKIKVLTTAIVKG